MIAIHEFDVLEFDVDSGFSGKKVVALEVSYDKNV